jgi:hypothetical protein
VTTQPEAKQVPLVERLESVPVDARLAVDDGPYSTSFYAVGAMAHEAADELRRLHSVNAELLEALKLARSIIGHPEDAHSIASIILSDKSFALISAAIARAEEVKP